MAGAPLRWDMCRRLHTLGLSSSWGGMGDAGMLELGNLTSLQTLTLGSWRSWVQPRAGGGVQRLWAAL
jgi:hypothetical protein